MNVTMYAALGLALLSLAQLALIVRLVRSARVATKADERVVQLTAALDLLTDATEEGFVNVASELERLGARPLPSSSSRRATTKRIAAALRKGRAIEDIAIAESLSESEVRLHLGLDDAMAAAPASAEIAEPEPDAATPGVLDDLENWMNSLGKARRTRGGRHVAVRA
ncbi:MAG: hypothetical protein ABI880_04905 [Acidobacteriota bacterium]